MKNNIWVVLALTAALGACAKKNNVVRPEPKNIDNKPAEVAKDRVAMEANKLPAKQYDVLEYRLNAQISKQNGLLLNGVVEIDFKTLEPLSSIVLNAELDQVSSVQLEGQDTPFSFDFSNQKLTVTLNGAAVGAEQHLKVTYRAKGNTDGGGLYSYEPDSDTDPLNVPVVFTSSEPRLARSWMPSQDRPDDRARFQIQFTMAPEESLIANGLLINDTTVNGVHTMKYRTEFALPSYVMAFAVGQFQVEKRQWRGKEISIWSRKGLKLDAVGMLDQTQTQLEFYSDRLGLYPWEKYAVVLLPDVGGGMENVSITFNEESACTLGNSSADRSLMAHELGHQWFGDWVTVDSWDDLWIKEGMATFLAAETFRPDQSGAGLRYTGDFFDFRNGQAIVDPSLPAEQKYNTGPYDRAGWFIGQLRVLVGESNFWATLRQILADHAQGNVTGEQFLGAFKPYLSQVDFARAEKALYAKSVPELHIADVDAQSVQLQLIDAEDTLLVPLDFSYLTPTAAKTWKIDDKTNKFTVQKAHADLVVGFDRNDVHPTLDAFLAYAFNAKSDERPEVFTLLSKLLVPATQVDLNWWMQQSSDAQRFEAFNSPHAAAWSEVKQSTDWKSMFDVSASPFTRHAVVELGCELAGTGSIQDSAVLRTELADYLASMPINAQAWNRSYFSNCTSIVHDNLSDYFRLMRDEPANPLLGDREVSFLASFGPEVGQDDMIAAWKSLSTGGQNFRVRTLAGKVLRNMPAAK